MGAREGKKGTREGKKGTREGKKGAREGKKGAREGKKGAAPFYFGLAGTLYNVACSSKYLEKYKIIRKLLSDPMVLSSPEWRAITPSPYRNMTSIDESFRNAHTIRIVFVSAWGMRRQGMGSTKDWQRKWESWAEKPRTKHPWISFQWYKNTYFEIKSVAKSLV